MAKYEVRKGFVVWIGENKHYQEGEEFELTDEDYKKFAHQVQPVSKRTSRSTTKETTES